MSASSSEGNDPNLTPILDMVFQLITFFMLVINFKGAAMDLSLQLPVLGSARPLEYHGDTEPMMLNLAEDGTVMSNGQVIDPERYIPEEARTAKMRQTIYEGPDKKELTVPVVIRADKAVQYSALDKIIRLCQTHGFRKFALSAMTREAGEEK